ncbi:MAG: YbaB/EbfC family nucleoid-associated protein [Malacoplasma sp.]|nr:YbaB/EbfC family nucleoid-associated protein [Malacoplasma sp.]
MAFNMQKMLQEAKNMQQKLNKKIAEFDKEEFEYVYKKTISIKIKGNLEILKIDIDKDLVDPEDKTMLEEMIAEAINEAIESISEEKDKITKSMMPSMPF